MTTTTSTELGPNAELSQDYSEDAFGASLVTEHRSLSFYFRANNEQQRSPPPSISTVASNIMAESTPELLPSTPPPYLSYMPTKSYSRPATRRLRQPNANQVHFSEPLKAPMMDMAYRKRKLQLLLQRKDVNSLVDAAASMSLEDDVEEVWRRARIRARERQNAAASPPSKYTPLSTIMDIPMEEEEEEEENDEKRKRKVPSTSENSVATFSSNPSVTKADWYCITFGPMAHDTSMAPYHHLATSTRISRPIVPLRRRIQQPSITLATITEEESEPQGQYQTGSSTPDAAVETCSSRLTSMKLSDAFNSSAEPYMLQLVR
ncbi:hypothetical protein FRB95_000925 [Tulasnella sp. JGI-2019a]|nr:hypothetical protein FRB95_000925 [Tulasnella sp. JGI-2019a]